MTTTQTDPVTALLLARCDALRIALEVAAREALAGNGFAASMQALSNDDRARERLDALMKVQLEIKVASKEGAR